MSLFFGFECNLMVADRRFEFHKRRQLFIGSDNETLSIVAIFIRPRQRFNHNAPRVVKRAGIVDDMLVG